MAEFQSYRDILSIDPSQLTSETLESEAYKSAYAKLLVESVTLSALSPSLGTLGLALFQSADATSMQSAVKDMRVKTMMEAAPARTVFGTGLVGVSALLLIPMIQDVNALAKLPLPKLKGIN